MKSLELKDKCILLTGADGFLGQYIRKALSDEGAFVICTDIRSSTTSDELNIADKNNIKKYLNLLNITGKKIDGLINNAAISFKGNNIIEEQFDKTLEVNIKGTYNMIVETKPFMTKNASIINISSIYGILSPNFKIYEGNEELYNSSVYGATKAAIIQMTKYYASQYAPIRVNAISPGGIFQGHTEDFVSKYSSGVPMKRMAQPEEVVNAILFLLSPLSSYITGQNLIVDGGLSIC